MDSLQKGLEENEIYQRFTKLNMNQDKARGNHFSEYADSLLRIYGNPRNKECKLTEFKKILRNPPKTSNKRRSENNNIGNPAKKTLITVKKEPLPSQSLFSESEVQARSSTVMPLIIKNRTPTSSVASSPSPKIPVASTPSPKNPVASTPSPKNPVASPPFPEVPVSSPSFPEVPVFSPPFHEVPVSIPLFPESSPPFPEVPVSSPPNPKVPVASPSFPKSPNTQSQFLIPQIKKEKVELPNNDDSFETKVAISDHSEMETIINLKLATKMALRKVTKIPDDCKSEDLQDLFYNQCDHLNIPAINFPSNTKILEPHSWKRNLNIFLYSMVYRTNHNAFPTESKDDVLVNCCTDTLLSNYMEQVKSYSTDIKNEMSFATI